MKRTDTGTEAKGTEKFPMLAEGKAQLTACLIPATGRIKQDQSWASVMVFRIHGPSAIAQSKEQKRCLCPPHGVLSSPSPFHSLSLLSRMLRVTDFTSISPGLLNIFQNLQWKQITIPQDWIFRTFFEISCHSVAQDCPELLCTTDPPALAFKVVGTTDVHHRAWQTLTFLFSPTCWPCMLVWKGRLKRSSHLTTHQLRGSLCSPSSIKCGENRQCTNNQKGRRKVVRGNEAGK